MKKLVFIVAVAAAGMFAFYGCGSSSTSSKGSATEQKTAMKTIYTCEMHPEVVSDKPGKCPKCGMELTEKQVPVDSLKTTPA
ncbi:MAG TPA: heavy metal-binding domain-containing protein, partial [Bacteroidales bacterium]